MTPTLEPDLILRTPKGDAQFFFPMHDGRLELNGRDIEKCRMILRMILER